MATQAMLDEARVAYHQIQTGTTLVEIRHEGQGYMRYAQPNAAALLAYINSLEAQLGVPPLQRTGPRRTPGRRIVFG